MTGPNPGRALEIGAKLGNRYTLSRRLGAGRATETWLAGDRVTGTPVALKILSGEALGAALCRLLGDLERGKLGRVEQHDQVVQDRKSVV